jgi:formate dehydrogenase subunit beta
LRPCEIRAFIELVKLKQGSLDPLIIIGSDCLGAYNNNDYHQFVQTAGENAGERFCQSVLTGRGSALDGFDLTAACRSCDHPVPDGADLAVGLFGVESANRLLLSAQSDKGRELMDRLELTEAAMPSQREAALAALLEQRKRNRQQWLSETKALTDSLTKLSNYLDRCVNCYNCRVACPVCYCRECVFSTDVFDHEPLQYVNWARRKGALKMPTDTLFYHLTRVAHIGTACVGCGQCDNACPNDVKVAALCNVAAEHLQTVFDYRAGEEVDRKPPLGTFEENEFEDVVG